MKYYMLAVAVVFLYATENGYSQKIEWSEDVKLTEADFKKRSPDRGLTQTVYPLFFIAYQQSSQVGPFSEKGRIMVSAYFMPTSSWIEDGSYTSSLLKYADVCFDLYEYGARLMRKELYEKGIEDTEEADLVHEDVFKKVQQIQAEYGKETSFGQKESEQHRWEQKVDSLMSQMSDYCKHCTIDSEEKANAPKKFK